MASAKIIFGGMIKVYIEFKKQQTRSFKGEDTENPNVHQEFQRVLINSSRVLLTYQFTALLALEAPFAAKRATL